MAQRSQNARDEQGRWDAGGGSVEFNESIDNRLQLEVMEEYSAEVLHSEFLGYQNIFRKQEGRDTHWIALIFKVLVDPNQVKIGEPHKFDNIGWFNLDNLPSPLHSKMPETLELYRDKLIS